jgi:ABC-2 type transport system ATP-binding protein
MTKQTAVSVEDLTRIFRVRRREARGQKREIVALQDVTLEVGSGELFGVLGPNGAGKTTMIKILSTLLSPTSGRARVAGVDVVDNPWEVRRHLGMVSGGESSGYGLLTVEENLWMFSQFYGIDSATPARGFRSCSRSSGWLTGPVRRSSTCRPECGRR